MDIFTLVGKMTIEGMDKANTQLGGLQNKVQGAAKGLRIAGAAMTAVGGIITGVATKAVVDFAKMGDEVHKMSLRTGFATETLSRLKYAAGLGGASLATVEKAAKRMAATIYDLGEGLSTSVDAMDHLNLTMEDFEGLNPEEQFMKLAGAIASIEDPSKRSALAQRIFGRAGTEMLPMLSEGTEGLKAMMKEAEKFGPIFSKDAANAAAKLTDTMAQLRGTFDKVKLAIAEKLVPAITTMLEKFRDTVSGISEWIEKNPVLTKMIVLMTVAFGVLLLVLGPLLIMLPSLVSSFGLLGVAMHFVMGPVGWVILGITALIAAGVALYKNWDKVTHFFKMAWSNIKIYFLEGVSKVIGALANFTSWIPFLGDKVDEVHDKIANMIESERVERDLLRVNRALELNKDALDETEEAVEDNIEGLDRWHQKLIDEKNVLDKRKILLEAQREAMEDMVSDVQSLLDKESESLSDFYKEWEEAARDNTEDQKRELDRQADDYRKAHDERMGQINARYDAELAFIDAFAAEEVKAYQDQIDAIDRTIKHRREAEEQRRNEEKVAELQARIDTETDADKREALGEDLQGLLADIERKRRADALKEEKEALRDQIDIVRQRARENKDRAKEEYDLKVNTENEKLQVQLASLEEQKNALDQALEDEMKRVDDQLQAFKNMNLDKLEDTDAFVKAYNDLLNELRDKVVTITTVHRSISDGGSARPSPPLPPEGPLPLAKGAIAMREVVARIGEQAPSIPEAVIPLSKKVFERLGLSDGGGYRTMNLTLMLDGREIASVVEVRMIDDLRVDTGIKT